MSTDLHRHWQFLTDPHRSDAKWARRGRHVGAVRGDRDGAEGLARLVGGRGRDAVVDSSAPQQPAQAAPSARGSCARGREGARGGASGPGPLHPPPPPGRAFADWPARVIGEDSPRHACPADTPPGRPVHACSEGRLRAGGTGGFRRQAVAAPRQRAAHRAVRDRRPTALAAGADGARRAAVRGETGPGRVVERTPALGTGSARVGGSLARRHRPGVEARQDIQPAEEQRLLARCGQVGLR